MWFQKLNLILNDQEEAALNIQVCLMSARQTIFELYTLAPCRSYQHTGNSLPHRTSNIRAHSFPRADFFCTAARWA